MPYTNFHGIPKCWHHYQAYHPQPCMLVFRHTAQYLPLHSAIFKASLPCAHIIATFIERLVIVCGQCNKISVHTALSVDCYCHAK